MFTYNNWASCFMNDSLLIKTKMVLIGADTQLWILGKAGAGLWLQYEQKTQSTRSHWTACSNYEQFSHPHVSKSKGEKPCGKFRSFFVVGPLLNFWIASIIFFQCDAQLTFPHDWSRWNIQNAASEQNTVEIHQIWLLRRHSFLLLVAFSHYVGPSVRFSVCRSQFTCFAFSNILKVE